MQNILLFIFQMHRTLNGIPILIACNPLSILITSIKPNLIHLPVLTSITLRKRQQLQRDHSFLLQSIQPSNTAAPSTDHQHKRRRAFPIVPIVLANKMRSNLSSPSNLRINSIIRVDETSNHY